MTRLLSHLRSSLACACALIPCTELRAGESLSWGVVKGKIRREFPNVQSISTAELAELLADKRAERPLLLDVRTRAEFDVSHLRGARRMDPGETQPKLAVSKQTPIVTYCSVGYRSAAMADRLKAAGFTNVRNLEGSIFQWANEVRPLVSPHGPAKKVHPYNRVWGMLLDRERRARAASVK